jgi:hypothetical protein
MSSTPSSLSSLSLPGFEGETRLKKLELLIVAVFCSLENFVKHQLVGLLLDTSMSIVFKTPSSTIPAQLNSSDLDQHDLIHGIVLPQLDDELADPEEMKREFTKDQAREIDLTALPTRLNHSDNLESVGVTLAYRVRETGGTTCAETLHKLHREPDGDVDPEDKVAILCAAQRDLLMSGEHQGLSLGHGFSTDYVADLGRHDASLKGREGRVIYKRPIEVSTCRRGKREGSEILEYLPCKKSLLRSDEDKVRSFCNRYHYTPPPADCKKSRDPSSWGRYVDFLSDEVQQRRRQVLASEGYSNSLKSRGIVVASLDESIGAPALPWQFIRLVFCSIFFLLWFKRLEKMTTPLNNSAAGIAGESAALPVAVPAAIPAASSVTSTPAGTVHNVLPNQVAGGHPTPTTDLDPIEQAAQNFAYAKAQKDRADKIEAELAQYKEREQTEQLSRKRKQEEDSTREKEDFERQKAARRNEIVNKKEKFISEGMVDRATLENAISNATAAIEAARTQEELAAAQKTHHTMIEILEQASSSALSSRRRQQQDELAAQNRAIRTWMTQPTLPGGIQSSGGVPQTRYDEPSGVHNASSSTSSFYPTSGQSNHQPQQQQQQAAAPAIDFNADNNFEQIFDAHFASNRSIPSLSELMFGGIRVETKVNNSASGPVTQVIRTKVLQDPLKPREYSWKSAAPELFNQLVDNVRDTLRGTKQRPEPAVMDEMNRNARVPMIPFVRPLKQDGWQTIPCDF